MKEGLVKSLLDQDARANKFCQIICVFTRSYDRWSALYTTLTQIHRMCIGSALVKFISWERYTPEATRSWSPKFFFSSSNLQIKLERLTWSASYKLNIGTIFIEGELVIILKWNKIGDKQIMLIGEESNLFFSRYWKCRHQYNKRIYHYD